MTKKELIQKYETGSFTEEFVYNPSAFDAMVIVDINDYEEYVFGYYQYMNEKKEFFKVKFYWTEHDQRFQVKGTSYYVSEFLGSSTTRII